MRRLLGVFLLALLFCLPNRSWADPQLPPGVVVFWEDAWSYQIECHIYGHCDRMPHGFRPVREKEKRHPTWRRAVATAKVIHAQKNPPGTYTPFNVDDFRYIARDEYHTHTHLWRNGKMVRVKLSRPVPGVSVMTWAGNKYRLRKRLPKP
jgi:hypothetical protein